MVASIVSTFGIVALAKIFSDPAEPWSRYPGVPQFSTDQILKNETVEELEPRVDAAMEDVRAAITKEFGFTWSAKGQDVVAYESNRFHGTSLLNTYDSVTWQTSRTLRTDADKRRAVSIVAAIMERHGFGTPALLNVTGPDGLQDFGGFTLEDQGRWVLGGHPPEVSRGSLQFTILDLTKDHTGSLAAASRDAVASLGWEPEYLSIAYHGDFMLKQADRAEFERRAEIYRGHILPVPGRNRD
ncbi:hypothetical protein BKA04_001612 [Cryobacterium mesophilum]|uniref:Uncharacterized protein n=1 Tax=Terrimesophilobacter mesophilus TaxID=433647 RepID=A0A4R8VCF3_9MICO|nr:hypothetical protein [Terrimesophilobacter mesophilus]MBB5633389.1 hypothetical protein [Terrimesophilobacter mesophilus]TFB80116.1 hypothetical protein E3N84_08715 [Terrimesophilobacter mesophilus]